MRCKLFLAIKFHDLKFLICNTHSYFFLEKLLLFLSPVPTPFLCFQFFQKEFSFCCSLFPLFHFSPVSQFLRLFDTVQRYVMLCYVFFILKSVWPNGWVFVYKLSGSGFESSCIHLNFTLRACFEQGIPWHSGNYRMWI